MEDYGSLANRENNQGAVTMASKTVWIVGGLLAVGAIAYVSYHGASAGKDAAGTIVEAKRTLADNPGSTNGATTSGTSHTNRSDDAGNQSADQSGADGRTASDADGIHGGGPEALANATTK